MEQPATRWSWPLRLIHWLMALALLGNIAVGWYADELPLSKAKLEWFLVHKSLGITLLALVVLRIIVRAASKNPPDAPMPAWQQSASRLSHLLLYLLMLMVPLAGWWLNSVANYSLSWFGLVKLFPIAEPAESLTSLAVAIHTFSAWTLLALVALHLLAALKHRFIDRDDVLKRML